MGHLSIAPIKGCVNVDSFGLICIHCNQCGRFNENKVKKAENNVLTENEGFGDLANDIKIEQKKWREKQ